MKFVSIVAASAIAFCISSVTPMTVSPVEAKTSAQKKQESKAKAAKANSAAKSKQRKAASAAKKKK